MCRTVLNNSAEHLQRNEFELEPFEAAINIRSFVELISMLFYRQEKISIVRIRWRKSTVHSLEFSISVETQMNKKSIKT